MGHDKSKYLAWRQNPNGSVTAMIMFSAPRTNMSAAPGVTGSPSPIIKSVSLPGSIP